MVEEKEVKGRDEEAAVNEEGTEEDDEKRSKKQVKGEERWKENNSTFCRGETNGGEENDGGKKDSKWKRPEGAGRIER